MYTLLIKVSERQHTNNGPFTVSKIQFLQFETRDQAEYAREELNKIEWQVGAHNKLIEAVVPLYE